MSARDLVLTGLLVFTTISGTHNVPFMVGTIPPITYQQFLDLQIGWTRPQITQHMNNNPGVVTSESAFGNVHGIQIVQYTNINPIATVSLSLTKGLLTTKSQSGLCLTKYPVTVAQFDRIEKGMTRAEVQAILGIGEVVGGRMNIDTVRYSGSNTTYGMVHITYMQGNVTWAFESGLKIRN